MAKKSSNEKSIKSNKNGKRNVNKQIDRMVSSNQEWLKLLKIVLVVICFLGIFYLLTVYIINKDSSSNNDTSEATTSDNIIQYEEILAGSSFSMNEDEYLVVYYDRTNEDLESEISAKISEYESNEDTLTIYIADLSNTFNKNLVSDNDSNHDPKDASELAFSGPTLIKFANGSVVDYIESKESIIEYLS